MMTSTATTIDADGDVRLWNVYRGEWQTFAATDVPDHILATLPSEERESIALEAEARRAARKATPCP